MCNKTFPDEEACIKHLENLKWGGNIISPFDPASKVYVCKGNRYRCRNTSKYFNVKTNTLFDNSKIPLQKWFLAIWIITCHTKGISSVQLAKDLGVTQKTAWFLLHRIRNCFSFDNNNVLNNEIEVDETYVGGKNKFRHICRKVQHSQGRSSKDKTPVFGMIERSGKLNAKKVNDVSATTLTKQIVSYANKDATIYSDEWLGYSQLTKIYNHAIVKHANKEYVNGKVHTNTIEGFWSLFKRGIIGIYHSVSVKHLQKYVDEFVFRYNTRKHRQDHRFDYLLTHMSCRMTYQSLTT
ncbi:IS1595 family transposase [Commensalibacter nepenthis]|uniref:IS1595 family transposase n=1 Tax=Commensalibacter nepenthis TaxID=3043872 RepID=A0ABT6Q5M4_9PROT|nr:IS1595 family transposase [Commensalibacter sp. TBRC 10068]MDI2112057.1 IS1595 family transposase [Commensalibacter sp. TBRC 10068]